MPESRTNLGPLTTPFKVPESCQTVIPRCSTCSVGLQAQTCDGNGSNTQGAQDDPDCWPERDSSTVSTKATLSGWGFYSPGISCPIGYATSCSATASVDGGFPFQFPLTKGETAIGCCPSGYQCQSNGGGASGQACYSIATDTSFTTASCNSGKNDDVGVLQMPMTITATASGQAAESTMNKFTIYAPLYQLNFQQTDLSSSPTETSDSSSNGPTSSSGALSTGVRAGIGACVGGIALSILAVSFFLLYRRKKKHGAFVPPNPEDFAKPENQVKPGETSKKSTKSQTPAQPETLA